MADINARASKAFPSPLEVHRFISKRKGGKLYVLTRFPSPLEVNRFISDQISLAGRISQDFPSPCEVDRFVSQMIDYSKYSEIKTLPSPCEVNRFIYFSRNLGEICREFVTVPSRGI